MTQKRKKWTAREEVTEDLIVFREKRKWQLALRRYVLEKQASAAYAPYFGIDIERFRAWIALQFSEGLTWDNFGSSWQFEHVVPIACFDFNNKEDLALCWNFINIRVERLEHGKSKSNNPGILLAKSYFSLLYEKTQLSVCRKMIEKISTLENAATLIEPGIENFIKKEKEQIENLATFSEEELKRINQGTSLEEILMERMILSRFG